MGLIALPENEVQTFLQEFPQWTFENNRLCRTLDCPSYRGALQLVQSIGNYAETQDHHPDLALHYKVLSVHYWTHTAGGVTTLDITAAKAVEALIKDALDN